MRGPGTAPPLSEPITRRPEPMNIHLPDGSIRSMDEGAGEQMLPIFRSRTQFHILGELFTRPGLEVTVGELAERIDAPQPSVSREIARLEPAGLLRTRKEGNRRLVRADDSSPIAADLRSLLTKLYGPVAEIRSAMRRLSGVHEARVFGSFARRWSGEPGPVPNDVDLLIVGDVDIDAVWSETAELSRRLGIEVNPVVRTPAEWAQEETGFAAAVRAAPRIDVTPDRAPGPLASESR
jgi:DNA-binding transcriptional ArsR family regulator